MGTENNKARWKFRFSIRLLLLGITAIALVLNYHLRRLESESTAADYLAQNGCYCLERNPDFEMQQFIVSTNGEIIGNHLPVRQLGVRRPIAKQLTAYRYHHVYVTNTSSFSVDELAQAIGALPWVESIVVDQRRYSENEIESIKSALPHITVTAAEMLAPWTE